MRHREAPLQLKVAHTQHWRVTISGEVDASAKAELCSLAELLCTRGDSVDFDLSGVTFVDRGGWGAVCAAQDLARSGGLAARVVSPSPAVRRLTELLRNSTQADLTPPTARLAPVA